MVPGNLPSQLEILSTGQTYYETVFAIAVGHDMYCGTSGALDPALKLNEVFGSRWQ